MSETQLKRKLVLGTGLGFRDRVPTEKQFETIKAVGFDGVFTDWENEELNAVYTAEIRRLGLYYQSIHAPFGRAAAMWEDDADAAEAGVDELIRCLRDAVRSDVTLVIMHAVIGFDKTTPTPAGIERYGRVFDEARSLGVRVAVENTEGEPYLEALLNAFRDDGNVRFCIDTGHELCYNGGRDMIGKYGDRLISTHLNDNMGVTGNAVTWYDDSHMLPFDGIADWENIARRLHNAGYTGDLTFELIASNRPERHTNDIYAALDFDGYVRLAYEKAVRFREILEKFEKM